MGALPEFLRPLFWEIDFDALRLDGREVYILERVLEYGCDDAIRWARRTFPPEKLAEVVRMSRSISPNTGNLWALVLDIPREDRRQVGPEAREEDVDARAEPVPAPEPPVVDAVMASSR